MTSSAYAFQRSAAVAQDGPADLEVISTATAVRTRAGLGATALTILSAALFGFTAYVGVIGTVVHARAQQLSYAQLREQLANGTAPLGQLDDKGQPLALGAPVALLEAPGIREVVREGTTAGVLTGGPGHRRDTPLPGQPGTSTIYGRAAAFGAPFGDLSALRPGTTLTVTTGQGRHRFRVIGLRGGDDPVPPVQTSRLTLVTAGGRAFLPNGVVYLDAELTSDVVPMSPLQPVAMTRGENALAGDSGALVGLVLWGLALVLGACLVVWMSARWGRRQSWLVGAPVLAALGTAVASSAAQLLPNLT